MMAVKTGEEAAVAHGLRAAWDAMIGRLGLDVAAARADFDAVIRAYGGADRKYHDLSHLKMVVEETHKLAESGAGGRGGWSDDLAELEAGLWFHDVIYTPQTKDSEEQSARLAGRVFSRLGLPEERIHRIARIITATRHDGSASTEMERLACDIDLLPLAVDDATFRRNTDLIRHEHPHVSEEDFRRGRLAFLEKMLAKGRVYYSDDFERRHGAPAVRNMKAAVERLRV